MNSSGDFNTQNFRSLIEKYETVIQDVTNELNTVQAEHSSIKVALKENSQLGAQLKKILADRINTPVEHKYKESDLIENLQLQLKTLIEEKEQTVKLWQNAATTVDFLEAELKIYKDNTEGLIPKAKLIQLKNEYECKIKDLQNNVAATKTRLEELINVKTQELRTKDQEIAGTLQTQDSTLKIVKNLEDEILNLQKRLNDVNVDKNRLEKSLKNKSTEIEMLKQRVKECRQKVEESLQVVEAALNEKDAALLRESKAKEQLTHLSNSLEEIINETNVKVKKMETENEQKLETVFHELKTSQEEVKIYSRKCSFLEEEIERLQKGLTNVDESGASKILTLEKNLESTFQKLLLSEKQNIQLKSEMANIKSDLDQMAHHYERDIAAREVERNVLKEEIRKLKVALDESCIKLSQNEDIIKDLNEKLSSMKIKFEEQITNMKEETIREREAMEIEHKKTVEELQTQLLSQIKVNKKWRTETKRIMESVEKRINELKINLNKVKNENKVLASRLRDSNIKLYEYRKFMDLISKDVSKITSVALPEMGEIFTMLTMLLIDNKNHSLTN